MAYMEQVPLYGIFIGLKKAYDAIDRDRCMEILVVYGVCVNMRKLIQFFWDNAKLVCQEGGVDKHFKARQGVPQGGAVLPRIFNVIVDAIIRGWLYQVLGDKVTRSGVGADICQFLAAFYANDGLIQARDPALLQSSFNILLEYFKVLASTRTQPELSQWFVFQEI